MTDDKKKRSSTDTARRIWLAGIGAYGRAFTEAQGALKEVTGKSSEVFDELVQKGEMIEKVVEYKGREILDKSKVGDIEMPSFEVDERIKRMRARLSMGAVSSPTNESTANRLNEIEKKISDLTARIEALEPSKPKPANKKLPPKAKTQKTKKPVKPK